MENKALTSEEQQIISRLVKTQYWTVIKKIVDIKVQNIQAMALDSDLPKKELRGKRDSLKELIGYIKTIATKND